MLTQRYSIDMVPGGVPLTLHVTQYDAGMTEFVFVPFASSGAIDLSVVTTARIEATKPDRLAVVNNCTYANGEATYVLQEQLTAKAGSVWSKLVLLDANNNVIASKAIVWEVDRPGVTDDATVSESDVPLLREAIEAAGRAENAADEAAATLANFATVVAEQVEQMQIHEGQTVIDGTLMVSGAAADAKVTGDKIRALEKATMIISTASGSPVVIRDGADDMPMTSVAVNIAPVQSGSGDPSPDNVRPISGWTAAKVTRTGKNLFPTASISLGKPNVRNQSIEPGTKLKPGTYCVSYKRGGSYTGNDLGIQAFNGTTLCGNVDKNTGVLTISDEATRFDFYFPATNYNNGETVDLTEFQLELGSTATAYEPYHADTYSVTFPTEAGTVYGGTLDVVKGTLTVDRAFKVFNGSEAWKFSPTSFRPNIKITGIAYKSAIICNMYPYSPDLVAIEGTITTNGGDGYNIWTKDSINGDSLANWKTFLASNNLQVVYELAEPIEYTLTPTEIRTLLGVNNVWADAGAVDVQYPADTKLYIDSKIAELQALVLENNG